MEINTTKGIALIILIVITIVCGFIPIWLVQRGTLTSSAGTRRKQVLDFFNCFAGGVFLSTCLLHLLAEGRKDMEEYFQKAQFQEDFPLYETTAAVGLFLVALVERVGFALMTFTRMQRHDTAQAKNHDPPANNPAIATSPLLKTAQSDSERKKTDYGSYDHAETQFDSTANGTANGGAHETATVMTSSVEFRPSAPAISAQSCRSEVGCDLQHNMAQPAAAGDVYQATGHPRHSDHHHHHDTEHHHHHQSLMASTSCEATAISHVSVVRALLLLIALSFHTIFDGLAVGLQDNTDSVWEVFAAIAVHKALVAFCLGLELATASPGKPRRPYVLIALFSLISPVGIAIGMGVKSGNVDELAQLLTSSVLQALATGTFLYVTFFEILGQQFAHNHSKSGGGGHCMEVLKVLVTAVGFAAMACVKLLGKD